MEIMLAKAFGWSVREMDETEIESLFEFVFYYLSGQAREKDAPVKYADQVEWL